VRPGCFVVTPCFTSPCTLLEHSTSKSLPADFFFFCCCCSCCHHAGRYSNTYRYPPVNTSLGRFASFDWAVLLFPRPRRPGLLLRSTLQFFPWTFSISRSTQSQTIVLIHGKIILQFQKALKASEDYSILTLALLGQGAIVPSSTLQLALAASQFRWTCLICSTASRSTP